MAHFGVLIGGGDEGFINQGGLESDTRSLVEDNGHSCDIWQPDTSQCTIDDFVCGVLKRSEPVALIYMGHGCERGWQYQYRRRYLYQKLARNIARLRSGMPTAVINDCCYSGSIARWLLQTDFDRGNTIALVAGEDNQTSASGETLREHHTYHVLDTWFNRREAFDPFQFSKEVRCVPNDHTEWEHWMRDGPERFGSQDIDWNFIPT